MVLYRGQAGRGRQLLIGHVTQSSETRATAGTPSSTTGEYIPIPGGKSGSYSHFSADIIVKLTHFSADTLKGRVDKITFS